MIDQKAHITVTAEVIEQISNEVARTHVLRLLDELQEWKDKGLSIQHYILIKRNLFSNPKN